MSEPIALEPLPQGHPCERCQVREKAACGVLDSESLAELKNLGSTLTLSAGQTLFRDGEAATRVFTLTRGDLKLHKPLSRRHRQIVGFLSAGDFLGIGVNGRNAVSAEMIEGGELCSFSRRRFDAFIADHPEMEEELYRKAFNEGERRRALAQLKTATERLALFLLALADRCGQPERNQPTRVRLPMSRADLADYLDLSEETLNRMLSRFEVARLIRSPNSRAIEILNRPLLEELVTCESNGHDIFA